MITADNHWLGWRGYVYTTLGHRGELIMRRIEERVKRDGDQAILTDEQAIISELIKMLDTIAAEVPPPTFAAGEAYA
jgi:hypothetical protein